MLEKNQRFKSLLYVLADAALLFIGFLLANYIRFNYVRYFEPGGAGPALAVARDPRNIIAGLATSLVLVLIYWVAGIYSTTRLRGLAERCTKIAVINAAGLLIFIGALYLMHLDDYSRIVLALFYILGTAGVVIERMILRWVDRARRREGLGLRHILLVGGGKSAALYLRALEHNPYYGFVVDGYLAGVEEPGLGVRYMGSYDALSARLDEIAVDEVVGRNSAVELGQLLLVERHAAALHELAHLALAGKHRGGLREELYGGLAQLVGRNVKLRHALEDVEQRRGQGW